MKCPSCELMIEDEAAQVRHVERCHPELLQKRWEDAGMDKLEIARQFIGISEKYAPLEGIVDECLRRAAWINISMTPDRGVRVHLKPHDGSMVDGHGVTLAAALCLAIDRLEYPAQL